MDFSDVYNDPEDSDVLLKFVPDQAVGMAAAREIQSTAEQRKASSKNATAASGVADLAAQAISSRKRGRGNADDASEDAAVDPTLMRTLHLHKLILLRSEYFKARIKRWTSAEQAGGKEPSASLPMLLELVEKVPEGQLDAAELAIKCMYDGAAPAEAAGNAMLLLHAYLLAERFDIPAACMDTIAAVLSALRPETLTMDVLQASGELQIPGTCTGIITDINNRRLYLHEPQAVFELPESLLQSDALSRLRNTCHGQIGVISRTADPVQLQQLLVTIYGDVPAVITSGRCLLREFCCLPPTAVLVWAKADNLRVHSENCVVWLLSAWVKAYDKARIDAARPCTGSDEEPEEEAASEEAASEEAASEEEAAEEEESEEEAAAVGVPEDESSAEEEEGSEDKQMYEELAHCVRVLHLSPSYLLHIVPSLPWFRSCSGRASLPYLQLQRAAGLEV